MSLVTAHSLQLTAPAREASVTTTKKLVRTCKGRTRQGKPCRNKPMRGRNVCPKHVDQTTEGRPTKFTEETRDQIYRALDAGLGIEKAAAFAGVQEITIRRWIEQGAEDLQANKQTDYAEFCGGVSRARVGAQLRLAEEIDQAAAGEVDGDWRAAAWKLERLAPEEFGQHAVVDHQVSGEVGVTDLYGGRQPVDVPLEKRERIVAILLEGEEESVDATVVE